MGEPNQVYSISNEQLVVFEYKHKLGEPKRV